MIFKKNKPHYKYTMDPKEADKALRNVFEACRIEQRNAKISEYQKKHKKESISYSALMLIVVMLVAVMLAMPFAMYKPTHSLRTISTEGSDIKVSEHYIEDKIFYLKITGDDIDYANIRIVYEDGTQQAILSYDVNTQVITFPYRNENINIYIPNKSGSTMHLLLSPKTGS